MTSEQRILVQGLIVSPFKSKDRLSLNKFIAQFPSSIENGKLALPLLEASEAARNAVDLQSALIIGFTFGFGPQHNGSLCRLIYADWHYSHEDIVSALQIIGLKNDETVRALYSATQLKLSYLDYDDSRALAIKAIWALGKIANEAADEKLRFLAESEETRLKKEALNQLRSHRQ